MPFTYSIDLDRNILFIHAEGTVTDTDVVSLSRKIESDPKFHPGILVFNDSSKVTSNRITANGIKGILACRKFSAASRVLLFPENKADFGMARMYQTYCELGDAAQPQIFQSRAEALAFINKGLPPEKAIK